MNECQKKLLEELKQMINNHDPMLNKISTSLDVDEEVDLSDQERLVSLKCEELLLALKIMMNNQRFYNEFMRP